MTDTRRDNSAGFPSSDGASDVAWTPSESELTDSNIARLMREMNLDKFDDLFAWSVEERAGFWENTLQRLGIVFEKEPETILDETGGAENPRWLPGAVMNISSSCFVADADAVAVLAGREGSDRIERTTFRALEDLVGRFAGALAGNGFQPGEGVALYMPMNLECVVAYLGVVRAGCRVVSIPDSFSAPEVKRRLEIGEARGIVTADRFVRAGKGVPLYEKVIDAGGPRAIVIPARTAGEVKLRAGDLLWDDFLADHPWCEPVTGDPYRVSNVLFSSGTTGTPKAIPWTHLTPIKCATDGHFHQDIRRGDVVAWPTNIGWMMGPWLIYASLINRAAMALYEGMPMGGGFARFVESAGVTMLGVIPSLVRAWRRGGLSQELNWSTIRTFSSTGEPSGSRDYRWLMGLAGGAPVIEYCGGTEIGGGYITGTVVQGASPSTFTTPTLGLDMVILDERGKPVGEGESGEVFLVPPSIGLSQELLNADHHEAYYADCPTGPAGQLLRRHGDQIERLPGGYYRAAGRADDTMNLGGIKVSSVELERLADGHEAILECAAVSIRDDGGGLEKLVLFAVPAREGIVAKELRLEMGTLFALKVNPLFKVYDLVLVDHLPRTASNKLMRRSLRDRYPGRTRDR